MEILSAKSDIRFRLVFERFDLNAPKIIHQETVMETNTSSAFKRCSFIDVSPLKMAITIFVSSINLPLIQINFFTPIFDCLSHIGDIISIQYTCKPK